MSALDKQVGGSHYKGYAIQPVEFITQNDLGFLEGCVIKRLCRWQMKDGIKDLRKAIHEIELLIEQTEAAEKRAHAEQEALAKVGQNTKSNPEWPLRACTCERTAALGMLSDCYCPPDKPLDAQNRAPAASSSYPPIVVPEGAMWPVGARNGTRILAWRPRRPGDLGTRAYGWVEVGFMWDDELVRYEPAS